MDPNTELAEGATPETQVDPWAAAFEAVSKIGKEDVEEPSAADGDNAGNTGENPAEVSEQQELSDTSASANSVANEVESGELDTNAGISDPESGNSSKGIFDFTDVDVEQYRKDFEKEIEEQAIKEIADEFIKRGIKNQNGVLGATIDDADICKRDSDGVPHFYNPETGREFTGDDPRSQAQQWVDNYNRELARVFNSACADYEQHLRDTGAPKLAVMEFAPKYEKLDPIRQGMFDNVIQDFELKDDSGQVIGYSCDLDKALALVDRQIAMIQGYAKEHSQAQPEANAPTGPKLDMKTSSGAIESGQQNPPGSLAEAMERQQDALLAKLKNN